MRISVKNKLLKRLSKLGDQVFPRRKELIKEVSEKFINDVDYFVSHRFSQKEGEKSVPPFVLRDEIKSLQALAKLLTLNTQAFTKTRKMLSECWDQIKEVEKDRKKEYVERSKEFEKNKEEFAPKIEELRAFCSNAENLSKEQILEKISTLQGEMRTLPLSREDVKTMRAEIQQIRNEALDKIQEKVDAKEKKDRKQIEELKTELTTILANEAASNLESLEEAEGRLREVFESLKLAVAEKQIFERNFSDLRSFILDKKGEKADTLDELENLLEEREELLNQVKQQVQDYRKEMGGSGLDFEKAMTYRELYDSAKIHLDKEVEAVDQLEEKIAEKES
jgi:DNA repair exonuclease SbcCD ATPase subunit